LPSLDDQRPAADDPAKHQAPGTRSAKTQTRHQRYYAGEFSSQLAVYGDEDDVRAVFEGARGGIGGRKRRVEHDTPDF
jgi:hypothetical protein